MLNMLNTLAGRALIPVGIAVTGFVVVCFLLLYTGVKDTISSDTVGHATNLADIILKSTKYAMLKSDRELSATIIKNIGQQKGVEHIRIFNKKGIINISTRAGELNQQVDKKTEGCIGCHIKETPSLSLGKMEQARTFTNGLGKSVLAITVPIYNEPECFTAACHFHPSDQKLLGTLDIGLSREMLISSMSSIRNQMIAYTLMILVLTVVGVTAILRRSVFLPIVKLRKFAGELETSKNQVSKPHHLPLELDRIAQSLYNLSHKRAKPKDTDDSSL